VAAVRGFTDEDRRLEALHDLAEHLGLTTLEYCVLLHHDPVEVARRLKGVTA
jgi:hypothetical protein